MSNKTYVLLCALTLAVLLPGRGRSLSAVGLQAPASSADPAQQGSQQAPASPQAQPATVPDNSGAVPEDSSSAGQASSKHKGAKATAEQADQPTGLEEEKKKAGKGSDESADDAPVNLADIKHPVLWHDPGDVASLDLFYGQGGKGGQPVAPYEFESEDMNGTNPKFDALDANKTKWRVKLGAEARPEVVASRLLWAVGYYVEDDYVLESADIRGLQMKRGKNLSKDGHITDARFARKSDGQKKIGVWEWKDNPFNGTKELNGLRVMMAVMNNWDLKDVNNSVFKDKKTDEDVFLCSDIGATFATNEIVWPISHSKGNYDAFAKSKFITRETDTEVDFATPELPKKMLIETGGLERKDYEVRKPLEWIGKNVPRQDAKWIGSLLGQLNHQQLVDAFRAGHFPPDQVDGYVQIVESRIKELQAL